MRHEIVTKSISRWNCTLYYRFILSVVLLALLHPAQAQLLDQLISTDVPGTANEAGVTVTSRLRPEYESLGIRAGNFTIRPQLSETVGYDDNVLGTSSARGSAVVETRPLITLDYDRSDSHASAYASLDDLRYLSRSSQSYTDWMAGMAGSLDIGRDMLTVSYDHQTLHQTARDLGAPLLLQPLEYRLDVARMAYRIGFNRVYLQPGVSVANYDYDNGTVAGAVYQQGYRNRVVVTPSVTLGYEMAPRRNAVLVVRDANATYANAGFMAARRNFNDISVLAGLDTDDAGIWRYRLLAGYESRSFSSVQYRTISSPVVEAAVIWSPSGLTTVTASGTRHVQDSSDETIAGYTETALLLKIDHELRRDVLLQASAGYYLDDYSQPSAHQSLYRGGVSATWLVNRNIHLVAGYDYTGRRSGSEEQSQGLGGSYDENRFLLTLRLAL